MEQKSWHDRITNGIVCTGRYLLKQFWFKGLVIPDSPSAGWPMWAVVFSGIVLLAITVLVVWFVKSKPWLAVGWAWFLITLLTNVVLIVGDYSMADRYVYLPSVGLLIMLIWLIPDDWLRLPRPCVVLRRATAAILVTLCGFSFHQTMYWHDTLTLFHHAIDASDENGLAEGIVAHQYMKRGDFEKGVYWLKDSVRIRPNDAKLMYMLGNAYAAKGDLPDALERFQRAIQINPGLKDAYVGWATATPNQLCAKP